MPQMQRPAHTARSWRFHRESHDQKSFAGAVLEASLALADKLIQTGNNLDVSIDKAFRNIICRAPEKKETTVLQEYLQQRQSFFKANSAEAAKIIKAGEYKPHSKNNAELAALMQVIQVIYNMEEAITKT